MLRADDIRVGRCRVPIDEFAFLDDIHLALDADRQVVRVISRSLVGGLLVVQDHAQGLRAALVLADKIDICGQAVRQCADWYANFTAYLRYGCRDRARYDRADMALRDVNQIIEAGKVE